MQAEFLLRTLLFVASLKKNLPHELLDTDFENQPLFLPAELLSCSIGTRCLACCAWLQRNHDSYTENDV